MRPVHKWGQQQALYIHKSNPRYTYAVSERYTRNPVVQHLRQHAAKPWRAMLVPSSKQVQPCCTTTCVQQHAFTYVLTCA